MMCCLTHGSVFVFPCPDCIRQKEEHSLWHPPATPTRDQIAKVLRQFYQAPLSMASIQPILDLAVELNPDLTGQPR